jgi:wyosine [tRNA(Phe)-imidazoG37] synthetase (radical SAM superfamily)
MNWIIEKIRPEKVQINTANRPPCEDFAFPVPEKRLRELSKLITGGVEIVAEKENLPRRINHMATHREILELIRRRPCTAEDAAIGLSIHASEAAKMLADLISRGEAQISRRNEKTYFKGITL